MAIAYDNGTTVYTGGTTGTSFSFTTSGSDRALIFCINTDVGTGLSATYNGVSMTQICQAAPTAPCGRYTTLFYLVAPASGANTLASSGGGASGTVYYSAASYTGVGSASTPDNSATSTQGTGTTNTNTITPSASNCWHVAFFESGSAGQSANTGTQRSVASNAAFGVYDTNGVASSPDSLIVNQTNQCGNSVGATIAPVVSAPAFTPRRTLLGVGQ